MNSQAPVQTRLAIDSVGRQLQQARAAKGLTLAEAAQQLHCDTALLDALENDRDADIGAAVFVRGHLRRYADFLGAPVDALCEQWSSGSGTVVAPPDLSRAPQAPRVIEAQKWGRRGAFALAAIVLLLALWWVLQGGGAAS